MPLALRARLRLPTMNDCAVEALPRGNQRPWDDISMVQALEVGALALVVHDGTQTILIDGGLELLRLHDGEASLDLRVAPNKFF